MVSLCATGNCITRPRRRRIAYWLAAVATVVSFDSTAVEVPLYDASSGMLPSDPAWGWVYGYDGGGALIGTAGGSTFLDTTPPVPDGRAGYNLWVGPGLNSVTGFTLDFSLRLLSETHDTNDRSGLSIIVFDSSNRGVELSFWTDEVWAKNDFDDFSHAEGVNFDTTGVKRSYRLTVLGSQYTLASAGESTLIGSLRDNYSLIADFPFNLVPYGQSNYIFFGDNTNSAAAYVELSSITLAPVPEPAQWILMLAGLGCVVAIARRQRRTQTKRVDR